MTSFNPNFLIGSIRIGTVEGASCINFGNNFPTGFESFKKQTQGFGNITGDHNEPSDIKSYMTDTDNENGFLEQLQKMNNDEIPNWIKEMIIAEYQKESN